MSSYSAGIKWVFQLLSIAGIVLLLSSDALAQPLRQGAHRFTYRKMDGARGHWQPIPHGPFEDMWAKDPLRYISQIGRAHV